MDSSGRHKAAAAVIVVALVRSMTLRVVLVITGANYM